MTTRIGLARVAAVIATSLLIGATSWAAAPCPEYVGRFSWEFGAEALDVASFGPYLFALSPAGLFVANTREPWPWLTFGEIEFSEVPVGYSVRGFRLRWPYAYVEVRFPYATDGRRILVVDVSRPWSPVEVGSMDFPEGFESFEVYRGHLYVWQESWLRIFDATDPQSPNEIGSMECPTFEVYDGFGISCEGSGMHMIDLSDPSLPVVVGTLDFTDFILPFVVDVSHGRAYVTDEVNSAEIVIVDVSHPSSPELMGSAQIMDGGVHRYPRFLAIRGETAYVAVVTSPGANTPDPPDYLYVLDISDLASPTVIGSIEASRFLGGTALVADGFVYIASPSQGVDVFDVRGCPTFPSHLHSGTLGERGDFTAGE